MSRLTVADLEDVTDALRRVIREDRAEADRQRLDAIERAARPLRFADLWLHEDVAADYLSISPRTLADLRRSGEIPFDTRERHRQHWYRRLGPAVDGRISLEGYVESGNPS